MRRSTLAVCSALLIGVPSSAMVGLIEGAELEHARANARAGGPVSEQDAELLDRWACSSGTRNPVCGNYDRPTRRYYRPRRHRH